MKAKNTIEHRERKNGYGREEWQKRKRAANAARPKQHTVDVNGKIFGPMRDRIVNPLEV